MPAPKKRTLADLLIRKGQTVTDSTNKDKVGLDVPLNKAPANASPDLHNWWEGVHKQNQLKLQKNKRRPGFFSGGPTV